jgi:hypothetical protein
MIAMLFLVLWLGVCAYALWRGAQPERFVALIFLAAVPAGAAAYSMGARWRGIELGLFAVDMVMLFLLLAIALKANRYWPIAIVAMQVFQVIGHLLKLADPHMLPLLYWLSNVVWAYPMLILLLLGTVRHRNRVKRLGPEPSWSSSSPLPG